MIWDHGVKGQCQFLYSVYKALWAQYRLQWISYDIGRDYFPPQYDNDFSTPEPKAQVHYCDYMLSIVRHLNF